MVIDNGDDVGDDDDGEDEDDNDIDEEEDASTFGECTTVNSGN